MNLELRSKAKMKKDKVKRSGAVTALFHFMGKPAAFKLEGIQQIDEIPVHKAAREAFVNLIIHADYLMGGLYFSSKSVILRKIIDAQVGGREYDSGRIYQAFWRKSMGF